MQFVGRTAILLNRIRLVAVVGGNEVVNPFTVTEVYVQHGGAWKLMRGSSAFLPALRKLEREFEKVRFDMQQERVRRLFQTGRAKEGLTVDDARRILWMYTSRDVYRMLVHEGGWSAERYQEWLSQTLLATRVSDGQRWGCYLQFGKHRRFAQPCSRYAILDPTWRVP